MKGVSSYLSLFIYTFISFTFFSFLFLNFKSTVEHSLTTSQYFYMLEQFKMLDDIIFQINTFDVGSKIKFRMHIPEGRVIIKDGKIKYEYEIENKNIFEIIKEIARVFDNVLVTFRNLSISCKIRSGTCLQNESCMFSLYKLENSHIGNCSVYNYKVCCNGIEFKKSEICRESEGEIVRLLREENSHADFEKYTIKICSYPIIRCSLKKSCNMNEICVISFYRDLNSHAAECNYYSNNLCCYTTYTEMVELILSYLNIEILGELILYRGTYEFIIEKIAENKIRIIL